MRGPREGGLAVHAAGFIDSLPVSPNDPGSGRDLPDGAR
jgi:hypothetical protein